VMGTVVARELGKIGRMWVKSQGVGGVCIDEA